MAKARKKFEALKAYLKCLGNPYASLQIMDDVEQKQVSDAQRPHVRHPYAYASLEEANDVSANLAVKQPIGAVVGTLSKAEFKARCRRIFEQYIPALEKSRLRTHHRDFIIRNESLSPETRHLLVKELQKYNLSTVPGLKAHFNRERGSLTDEKLRQIERLVNSEN